MSNNQSIDALVTGGKATSGPPLGPALGPLGVNIMDVINKINESTKNFNGMKIPITVNIDPDTKKWDVVVGIPSTSALILKEAGIKKGTNSPKEKWVADINFEQIIKISEVKMNSSYGKTLKKVSKEIIGTCLSAGVKVNGKTPKEIIKEIDKGVWDNKF
ncbi:MAG: 50S ribosomal protein L11 [Nitrosopumilaceae archaeon]|nr:50S ribosomal protein L11 [Nitrosopumilaceae archaeon]